METDNNGKTNVTQMPAQSAGTSMVEAQKMRAVQEVQAALTIARHNPRDELMAEKAIMVTCSRLSFAEQANYSFPRGKDDQGKKNTVTGPSIKLAIGMAQRWGNLDYGFRVLDSDRSQSTVEAYAWDMETNVRARRTFPVEHRMGLKNGGSKTLTDPRDIYEHIANNAQRRVRACILEVIPSDVTERAVLACKKTLAAGVKSVPMVDQVRIMVTSFGEYGVTKELIEKRLEHPLNQTSAEEIVELKQILTSMKDGMSKREDWFDLGKTAEGGAAADLSAQLKAQRKPAATAPASPTNGASSSGQPKASPTPPIVQPAQKTDAAWGSNMPTNLKGREPGADDA